MISFKGSTYSVKEGIHLLDIDAKDNYSAGYAYGTLLKKGKYPAVNFLKRFDVMVISSLAYFLTMPFHWIMRMPKDYKDELRGYSDSTGIPLRNLIMYNNVFDLVPKLSNYCTTISFFSGNDIYIARNTDTYGPTTKLTLKAAPPIVIRSRVKGKIRFTHVAIPFIAGAIVGWNDEGIAAFNHQISYAKKTSLRKCPTSLIVRMILENNRSVQEVRGYIRKNPTNRPVKLHVVDRDAAEHVLFEIHPRGSAEIKTKNRSLVCGTIFRKVGYQNLKRTERMAKREKSAEDLVNGRKTVDVDDMISFLADTRNGIEFLGSGASISNEGTFQSFVLDLKRDTLYVSNGKTSPVSLSGKYVKIRLSR